MEMVLLERLRKRLADAPAKFETEAERIAAGRKAYNETARELSAIKVAEQEVWPRWVASMEASAAMGDRSVKVEMTPTEDMLDPYWTMLSGLARRHGIQARQIPESGGRIVELSW